jgi:ABC-type dipeptide/oligopeptide/nickel transport system ATPase component
MSKSKKDTAELVDWYSKIPSKYLTKAHNPHFNIHGLKLPFRMLIIGGSGSGKTQTLMNIIHNMNDTFNDIYVITKNKQEPIYEYLEDKLGGKGVSVVEGIGNAPDLDKDINKKDQTLIVMDDLVLEANQKPLEEYFIRARKQNCSLIYISQSYYAVPKMIRKNLNYLVIKQLSSLQDLFRIMREYSLGDNKVQLKKVYDNATTANKQDFLLVDLDAPPDSRFRKNFNDIYEISQ